MTQTIVGLFGDRTTAERARTELAAVGLTRTSTYSEDGSERRAGRRQLVLVEADGRQAEAREILVRSGAESLEEHAAGVVAAQALRHEEAPASAEAAPEEQHP